MRREREWVKRRGRRLHLREETEDRNTELPGLMVQRGFDGVSSVLFASLWLVEVQGRDFLSKQRSEHFNSTPRWEW